MNTTNRDISDYGVGVLAAHLAPFITRSGDPSPSVSLILDANTHEVYAASFVCQTHYGPMLITVEEKP